MSKEKNQITQKNGQFIFVLPSGALQHRQSCFPATHSVGVLVLKQTLNLVVGKKNPGQTGCLSGKIAEMRLVYFAFLNVAMMAVGAYNVATGFSVPYIS